MKTYEEQDCGTQLHHTPKGERALSFETLEKTSDEVTGQDRHEVSQKWKHGHFIRRPRTFQFEHVHKIENHQRSLKSAHDPDNKINHAQCVKLDLSMVGRGNRCIIRLVISTGFFF